MKIERYAVYWVDLNPAVVISDNDMNEMLETVVVCPLTSRLHPRWPSRVRAVSDGFTGEIAIDQIRTISRMRIGDRIGRLDDATAAQVRHVVTEMYGLLSIHE